MSPFKRKTAEEKAAEADVLARAQAAEQAARAEAARRIAAHVATLPKWEYHVESIQLTSHWTGKMQAAAFQAVTGRLDALGAEGWELVSYEPVPVFGSISQKQTGYAYLAVLKRPALP